MNNHKKILWFLIWGVGLLSIIGLVTTLNFGSSSEAATVSESGGDIHYTLRTGIHGSNLVFYGVSDSIRDQVNPTLKAKPGDQVTITLINGEGGTHDVSFPEFDALSDRLLRKNDQTSITFKVNRSGQFDYFCTVIGHRTAGMEGKILIGNVQPENQVSMKDVADISRDPSDIPPPIGNRPPKLVKVYLEAKELDGKLDDGTVYRYWTFNGKIPAPFIRAKVGDHVEFHLKNDASSTMVHSIDLHAVTGPGGGSALMQAPPGEERVFTAKVMKPGLFVYHCATPMVAHHISNGMYGMILVEPKEGLRPVDREFYVMQGEIYTKQSFGTKGKADFSELGLLAEAPTYFVFNGAVGALTEDKPLEANVGETIRIFFGVGGPNYTSSFHMIGEIMDRLYNRASLTSKPLRDIQTTSVPPGGATIAEYSLQVPGKYILVDHALSRMEHGLVGYLKVKGDEHPEIYHQGPAENPTLSMNN